MTSCNVTIKPLTGSALEEAIPGLARLRVSVFAEFPYLYDGDDAYESRYLETYREAGNAIVAGAFDGEKLVGAATGTPMLEHEAEFAAAFDGQDYDLTKLFYCGESVLMPDYRGQGIGHRFFDVREAHARGLGATHCCFCAVVRPDGHPARPSGYRPLDAFWEKRGYRKLAGVTTTYRWKDIGEARETGKPMQFWMRKL